MAFTPEMAAASRRLKLVQVPGAGLDRIQRAALPAGARWANAYGHDVGIAEYVIGAMLALTRSFGRLDASLRRGVWRASGIRRFLRRRRGRSSRARRSGSSATAASGRRWPAALGRSTWPCAPSGNTRQSPIATGSRSSAAGARSTRSCAGPTTSRSRSRSPRPPADYLGERELSLLKPTAMLVNVARADILDEGALYRALAEGTIAGAALDVWYRYPTGCEPHAAQPLSVSRAAERPHDAPRVGLDRGNAGGARRESSRRTSSGSRGAKLHST